MTHARVNTGLGTNCTAVSNQWSSFENINHSLAGLSHSVFYLEYALTNTFVGFVAKLVGDTLQATRRVRHNF